MSPQDTSLFNKYGTYALITGASEGIGRAFAWQLAQEGFNLVLVARREYLLNDLAAEIKLKYPVACQVIKADLAIKDEVDRLLEVTASVDIGVVVCNAGFGLAGNFLDNDVSSELEMISVNCYALAKMTHDFGIRLKKRGRGAVLLLSSIVATQGIARTANYAATKAYVLSLGEALQLEWRGSGVDLLIVAPGPVDTGFSKRSKMQFGQTTTPEVVAKESINAIGRKSIVHPGALAKLMKLGISMTPRYLRVKIISTIMRGMTQQ